MAESKPVEIPSKATPLEPGDPEEAVALSQMGATFAERQNAREKAAKAVSSSDAENKAVKKSSTKKKAAKKS